MSSSNGLTAVLEGKFSQIPPPERSSYLCQAALVYETLKISREELFSLFAEHDDRLVVGEWNVKYLPDRHWVIFDRRPENRNPAQATTLKNTQQPPVLVPATVAKPEIIFDPIEVGNRARAYQSEMRRLGLRVPTATEAVHHILLGLQ